MRTRRSSHRQGVLRFLLPASAVTAVAIAAALASQAGAAVSDQFRSESYTQFRECEAEGLILHQDGWVAPGLEALLMADPGVRTIWSIALLDGGDLLLATGDQGQLLRGRPGAKDDRSELITELFDYEIFALALGARGEIFAAGAPAGAVVRVDLRGETRTLFNLPESVAFALLSGRDGEVYAATGERGRLYRITKDGRGEVVSESADLSIRSLAWAPDGTIWAGTDGRGLVQRIDPKAGSLATVYDSRQAEVVALIPLEDGGLYFATNPAFQSQGSGTAGNKEKGRGNSPSSVTGPALFHLTPEGSATVVWQCPERAIHCLARDEDGSILVGTGDAAALYRIDSNGTESLLWRPGENQVLSILRSGGTIHAGTGNPGRWYRLEHGREMAGTLTSRVLDAGDPVSWGRIHWNGTGVGRGGVEFETRSGFTQTPDPSWNDWQKVSLDEERSGAVPSPPARFLQWKARFKPDNVGGPVVYGVRVTYAGANRRPRIEALRVSPDIAMYATSEGSRGSISQLLPGGVHIDYSLPPPGMMTVSARDVPTWVRRIRSVAWEATDPDGDILSYTLEIRAAGETEFRALARDIRETAWSFEEGMIPDGTYQMRLTVSDEPSNAPGTALKDSRLTPPFRVDTIPPVIDQVRVRRTGDGGIRIEGRARDENSPVTSVEVSLDNGPFLPLTAGDGIFDSLEESFHGTVRPASGQTGEWIVIRAQDAAGNRGSHRAWIESGQ